MRDLYPPQAHAGSHLWSENDWSLTDGGTTNQPKPAGADHVHMTLNSVSVTLDENSAALDDFTLIGYVETLHLATFTLDIDGPAILDGTITSSGGVIEIEGNFTLTTGLSSDIYITLDGTGNVTCNGNSAGQVTNNTTGTNTVADAFAAYSWTNTAGEWDDGGFAHTIETDIIDNDVLTSTGTWTMTDNGNIQGGTFDTLVLAAPTKTSSLTGNTICKKLTLGTGTLDGAFRMDVQIGANGSIVQDAAADIDVTEFRVSVQAALLTNAALNTSAGTTQLNIRGNARTLRMTGDLNCGTNELYLNAVAAINAVTLDLATNDVALTAGDVVLGFAGAGNRGGILNTGTVVTITGAVIGGDATNKASNELNFPAGATVNLTGSITGTNIDTITAGAGVTITGGGTLTNLDTDPGNVVICQNMIDGGGNHVNYVFVGDATWDASTDDDWGDVTNWTPEREPVDGSTATFAGTEAGYPALPNANLPGAGVISFTFTGAYTVNINDDLLNGASVGLVTIDAAAARINPGANFAGAAISDGTLVIISGLTSSQAISVTGTLDIWHTLQMDPGMDVQMQLGGTITSGGAGVLDGDLLAVGNATVDWGGALDIIGSFDAQGFDITHTNLADGLNSLRVDLGPSNLDLGSNSADLFFLDIVIATLGPPVTATRALTARSWQSTGSAQYVDGGFDHNIKTDILDEATLLTSTGTWTMTGSGDIAGGSFAKLILAAAGETTALTATMICRELALGAGTLTGAYTVYFQPVGDNKLTQHADNMLTVAQMRIWPGAATVTIGEFDSSGATITNFYGDTADRTIRLTGPLTFGAAIIASGTAGQYVLLDLATNDQALTAGNVTLGAAGGGNKAGQLNLGPTSTITGDIKGGHTDNAGANVLTLAAGGTHNWSGSIVGTNIGDVTAGKGCVIQGRGRMSYMPNPGVDVDCRDMIDMGHNDDHYKFSYGAGATAATTSTSAGG